MEISSDDDRGGCDVEDGESAMPISSGADEIDEHQPSRSRSHLHGGQSATLAPHPGPQ